MLVRPLPPGPPGPLGQPRPRRKLLGPPLGKWYVLETLRPLREANEEVVGRAEEVMEGLLPALDDETEAELLAEPEDEDRETGLELLADAEEEETEADDDDDDEARQTPVPGLFVSP